jgi:hypothetical protein
MPEPTDKKDDDTGTQNPPNDQDTGTDGDDGYDDTGADDYVPPSKEDWDKVQLALKKARAEARAARRGKTTDNGQTGGDGNDKPDPEKVKADAQAEADGKWKPRVVRAAARSAFIEAGLSLPKKNADAAMARVLKLLDMDDLDVTDDGEVEGLDEQVEEIKADWPDLFGAAGRSRAGRVDGADRGTSNGKPKTPSEIQAAALLGR